MSKRRVLTTAIVATVAFAGFVGPAQAAEPLFQLPFPCGQRWHGNNTNSGPHQTLWEIDFNSEDDLGKPVVAAAAGTVVTAAYQERGGFGNLVQIRHSGDYHTYYAHLKDMTVGESQTVSQGQLIGHVGDTSAKYPDLKPHLHYEVRLGTTWPDDIVRANFDGESFPYPDAYITSQNCGGGNVRSAKSVNGDKYDDAVGIDSDGFAWLYFGKAGGGFSSSKRLGGGWNAFNRIAIGDSDADGLADFFATQGDHLYYWHNTGSNSFADAVRLGAGWNAVDYFSIVDVNGDNKADILSRDGGTLRLYIGHGKGSFASPTVAGAGWSPYRRHTAADADGDGDGDIWATNAEGDLYYWKRVGGSFTEAIKVGSGWNGFPQMTTMDINGDGKADIIAIRASDNTLWQWLGNGNGTVDQATQIGHGWGGFRLALY